MLRPIERVGYGFQASSSGWFKTKDCSAIFHRVAGIELSVGVQVSDFIDRVIDDLTDLARHLDSADKERVRGIIQKLQSSAEQGESFPLLRSGEFPRFKFSGRCS